MCFYFKLYVTFKFIFQYRKPIGKVIRDYNVVWCDVICPTCKKSESLDQPNISKNTNISSAPNGNIQTTIRGDKTSSFYSPKGFNQNSFHQIQQHNGNIPNYSLNVDANFGPNVTHNYKLSTLANPLKVCSILSLIDYLKIFRDTER